MPRPRVGQCKDCGESILADSRYCRHHAPAHREKTAPAWLPDAVTWYRSGWSYAMIASQVGRSQKYVRAWLQGLGVRPRTRSEAGKERIRREDPQRVAPPVLPSECVCSDDCPDLTTGVPRRGAGKRWIYPEYARGHWRAQPRPGRAAGDYRCLPWAGWIEHVERWCVGEGLSFEQLGELSGVDSQTVVSYQRRLRPANVLKVAKVMGLDPSEALELAGYERPSPIRLKLLLCLREGQRVEDIAGGTGVPGHILWSFAYGRRATLKDEYTARLAPYLGLSEADQRAEHERHAKRMRPQWEPGLKKIRRNHSLGNLTKGPEARRDQATEVKEAFKAAFDRYRARGLNPKARLYWKAILTEVRGKEPKGSDPTAAAAYSEWLGDNLIV